MAEEAAAEGTNSFVKALTRKAGPFPLWVYFAVLAGAYIYLKRRQSAATSTTPTPGMQTDPAGHVGNIDPTTGYVYGTPEDQAALSSQNANTGTTSSGGSNSTVAGQYADNSAWGRAAINYLVGLGVDPVEANAAVTQYIASQTLTPQQQADVNLVIQGIGAPPTPPEPGGAPPPIVVPPSPGIVYATNPPTGLSVQSTTGTTITLVWSSSSNATGYTVTYQAGSQPSQTLTVGGTSPSATISGLQPGTRYTIQVQATPAKTGDPFASTSATTATTTPAPGPTPTPTPAPSPPPPGPHPVTHRYIVRHGDTLSKIAASNGISMAQLKQLNPEYWTNPKYKNGSMIWAGDTVTLPGKG